MEERLIKQAGEITDGIIKRAEDLAMEAIDAFVKQAEVEEAVDIELEKMSEADLEKYSEDIAYAKGIAYGEVIGKTAAYEEAVDVVYTALMEKISEVFGKTAADDIDAGLKDGEPPVEEVASVATEAAAKKLIEQAGGEKAIEGKPEVAKQIAETAQAIGEQVAQEVVGTPPAAE